MTFRKNDMIYIEGRAIHAKNQDGEVIPVIIDELGRIINVDILHDLVHDGRMFFISYVFRDVPDGSTVYIQHTTASGKALHSQIEAESVGKWLFQSFANPTITDQGTELIPINRKSNGTYVVESTFYREPTVTDQGTARLNKLFGSGTQPSRFSTGDFSERLESVFTENVSVLVGFTNESGSTQDLTVTLDFYETPNF